MRTRRFELLRPAEIVAEKQRCPVIYLPLGPLEWHGPHLPLGVDPLRAYHAALGAAEQTGGVVLPPFFWGTERERSPEMLRSIGFQGDEHIVGMDFPANSMKSLYCAEEFLALLVRHLLDLLIEREYRIIALVSGHGAENQIATLTRLTTEYNAERPVTVVYAFVGPSDAEGETNWGHADAEETSVMMHLYPGSVDLTGLPPPDEPLRNTDWAIVDDATFRGNPSDDFTVSTDPRTQSSAQAGEENLRESVRQIAEQVALALRDLEASGAR